MSFPFLSLRCSLVLVLVTVPSYGTRVEVSCESRTLSQEAVTKKQAVTDGDAVTSKEAVNGKEAVTGKDAVTDEESDVIVNAVALGEEKLIMEAPEHGTMSQDHLCKGVYAGENCQLKVGGDCQNSWGSKTRTAQENIGGRYVDRTYANVFQCQAETANSGFAAICGGRNQKCKRGKSPPGCKEGEACWVRALRCRYVKREDNVSTEDASKATAEPPSADVASPGTQTSEDDQRVPAYEFIYAFNTLGTTDADACEQKARAEVGPRGQKGPALAAEFHLYHVEAKEFGDLRAANDWVNYREEHMRHMMMTSD